MRWFHGIMKLIRRNGTTPPTDIDIEGEVERAESQVKRIRAARMAAELQTPRIEKQTLFNEASGERNHFGESMYLGWQSRYGSGNV